MRIRRQKFRSLKLRRQKFLNQVGGQEATVWTPADLDLDTDEEPIVILFDTREDNAFTD